MSTNSVISLPPQLVMTPRSIPLLSKKKHHETFVKTTGVKGFVNENLFTGRGSNAFNNNNRTLVQLSESTFPINPGSPVNVRILLHAADHQMNSSRPRKVKFT